MFSFSISKCVQCIKSFLDACLNISCLRQEVDKTSPTSWRDFTTFYKSLHYMMSTYKSCTISHVVNGSFKSLFSYNKFIYTGNYLIHIDIYVKILLILFKFKPFHPCNSIMNCSSVIIRRVQKCVQGYTGEWCNELPVESAPPVFDRCFIC